MKNVQRDGEKGTFMIYSSNPWILFYDFNDIFKGFYFQVFIFDKIALPQSFSPRAELLLEGLWLFEL